ncbi:MAG TPA: NAD(P)H-hydrate dehydratase, partial [Candidatus Elarobacter sp.]|nr:NAD(P)H-hydrate dehydratase [Candidatus Elarobacter sp.]
MRSSVARRGARDRTVSLSRTWLRRNPLPRPDPEGDKNTRGTVLVVGGALTMPGAVLLAGIGALRAGAGKLQLATCRDVIPQLATAVPEALVTPLPQTDQGGIGAAAADEVVHHAEGLDALLLGPGMVDQLDVDAIVQRVLADVRAPTLIFDAAALASLGKHASLARVRDGRIIATPHAGEMASMLGVEKDDVLADPRGFALRAAKHLHAVVVLKGARTYVASPDGAVVRYTKGGVGLGTSGSGDTLAGIVAGLAARGAEPMVA